MRLPRIKTPDHLTYYHVRSHVCGLRGWYPFHERGVPEEIYALIQKFVGFYCCGLVSWNIMGNHLHLILRFLPYRRLPQRELERRARAYYKKPADRPQTRRDWKKFNRRLFDLTEFMRNLDGAIAKMYQRRSGWQGHLFGDRFKSSILESAADVLQCMIYLALNPTRAGLVDAPEQWRWGSAWQRINGEDRDLVPLEELMPGRRNDEARRLEFKWRMYWGGAIGGEEGKRQIPDYIIEAELARGEEYGSGLQRQRWISNAGVIGSFDLVAEWLEKISKLMAYRRRHNPVPQLGGSCFTLRPQRRRRWDPAWVAAGPG